MKRILFVLITFFFFLSNIQAGNEQFSDDLSYPTNCGEALVSGYQYIGSDGGDFSFNVTAPPTCTYSITNATGFAAVTSPNMATGNSTVTYSAGPNNSLGNPRYGVIIVGAKTFTVNQGVAKGGMPARRAVMDSNRDRNTDFVAIQNNGGNMTWWSYRYHIVTGGSSSVSTFGLFADDIPVPNDFDGDLRSDIAVWRGGTVSSPQSYFYIFYSQINVVSVIPWGTIGDNPNIRQDFDGDFRADLAVTRKQGGKLVWYIWLSATNKYYIEQFGNDTDRPIRGDYDGDFHSDLAVYRPNSDVPANTFYVFKTTNSALSTVTLGNSDTDKVVPGDYDGDNKTDYAVWRTTNGVWSWISGAGGNTVNSNLLGMPGDLPVPGDYNDNNRTDFAVFRPSTGEFFVQITSGFEMINYVRWGNSTMKIPANSMQVQ